MPALSSLTALDEYVFGPTKRMITHCPRPDVASFARHLAGGYVSLPFMRLNLRRTDIP
jgi:hypothetical protein